MHPWKHITADSAKEKSPVRDNKEKTPSKRLTLSLSIKQPEPSYHWFYSRKTFYTSFSSLTLPSPTFSSSFILALFKPFRKLLLLFLLWKSPSHSPSHPCQGSWLEIQSPPSPFSLPRSHTGGGICKFLSFSFPNWLIEARALWRPCLWAALFLSLSPLTTCVLVPSASGGCIYCNEPFIHLGRQ